MDRDVSELIDRIYEAGLVPELWPSVLDLVSEHLDGLGGLLFTTSREAQRWVASDRLRDDFTELVAEGWLQRNTRLGRANRTGTAGYTVSDLDLFSLEELDRDPLYTQIRKRGWGWFVGTAMTIPGDDQLVLNFERAFGDGPFGPRDRNRFELLRPHFARAMQVSARLGLERSLAAVEVLGRFGLATALLSQRSRMLASNALFQSLIPSCFLDGLDRLRIVDARADQMLVAAAQLRAGAAAVPLSIPIPRRGDDDAMVVHVVPIRRSAHDLFSNAACMLVATVVARKPSLGSALIQGLFELTAREAETAHALVSGQTVEQFARRSGVSVETVRSQLKSVFRKTGTTRQADLILQLAGLTLPTTP